MLINLGGGTYLNLANILRIDTDGPTSVRVTYNVPRQHTDAFSQTFTGDQAKVVLDAAENLSQRLMFYGDVRAPKQDTIAAPAEAKQAAASGVGETKGGGEDVKAKQGEKKGEGDLDLAGAGGGAKKGGTGE
jgi:hypothetical protein